MKTLIMKVLHLSLILCFTGGLTHSSLASELVPPKFHGFWVDDLDPTLPDRYYLNITGKVAETRSADFALESISQSSANEISLKLVGDVRGNQISLSERWVLSEDGESLQRKSSDGSQTLYRAPPVVDQAAAAIPQRTSRSLNIAPTLLPLAATMNNPPVDRLNTANRADVDSQNTQTVQPPMQPTMNSENIVYTVVAEGQLLKCIDTSSGMVVGSINFAGTLIQGPTVTGNRCTVVTDSYLGKKGTVYEIPMFSVVTSFDVMP